MRHLLLATATIALLAACSPAKEAEAPKAAAVQTHDGYNLQAQYDRIAEIDLTGTDTSFLTDEERKVVNLLIEAAGYMDEIYLRQVSQSNPATRKAIKASGNKLMLQMFDRHFGPWDTLDESHPFWAM